MPFLATAAAKALERKRAADAEREATERATAAQRERDARAADEAARAALDAAARGLLHDVLGPEASAQTLHTEDLDPETGLVVLSDAVTCLAVQQAGTEAAEVWLVRDVDQAWERVARVRDLEHLGELLTKTERDH